MEKGVPRDTYCSGNYHRKGFEYVSRYLIVCLSEDRCCHCDSVTTVHDAVTKPYRYVAEIKMKAALKDGCGPSKVAGSRW